MFLTKLKYHHFITIHHFITDWDCRTEAACCSTPLILSCLLSCWSHHSGPDQIVLVFIYLFIFLITCNFFCFYQHFQFTQITAQKGLTEMLQIWKMCVTQTATCTLEMKWMYFGNMITWHRVKIGSNLVKNQQGLANKLTLSPNQNNHWKQSDLKMPPKCTELTSYQGTLFI